jgi:hypothetical protein
MKARRSKSPVARRLNATTEFLNVDLDVRSRRSLAPLLKAWPSAQTPDLKAGRAPRWLLLAGHTSRRTADEAVGDLVRLIGALPTPARRCWREASSRVFDVGIQAGMSPSSFEEVQLRGSSLQAIARLGGRLLITIYAPTRE